MIQKKLEDMTLLEKKALILDHIDNINTSQQAIQILRRNIQEMMQGNGNAGNLPITELSNDEKSHLKEQLDIVD